MQTLGMLIWLMLVAAIISSGCNSERKTAEIEKLKQERQELVSRLESLQEEQRFLLFEKEINATDKRYLVLDIRSGKGSLRIGGSVLREFKLIMNECLRPEMVPPEDAATYVLPKGAIQIIAKKKEPVWYKPDWLYEKDGKSAPGIHSSERLIKGPMGQYAIFFGGGFVIHGRPMNGAPHVPMEHACIILEDDDLRVVYNLLDTGSVAYVR